MVLFLCQKVVIHRHLPRLFYLYIIHLGGLY